MMIRLLFVIIMVTASLRVRAQLAVDEEGAAPVEEIPDALVETPPPATPVATVLVEPLPADDLDEEPVTPAPAPVRPRVNPELRNRHIGGRDVGHTAGPKALSKPAREKDTGLWKNEIELGASGYRGNNDADIFMVRVFTERKKDLNSFRLGAKAYIGNRDGERDRENVEAEAGLRREIHNRWYYTAEVRYFADKLADLDYQVVSVLSPGYEFVRSDISHASLELGPAYIAEKKSGEQKDFVAARLALMMDRLIDERILIWERFEYLPAIEDTSVYLMLAEVGAESALTDWFRLRTALQVRYDSDPAENKENEDLFLTVSIVTVF